MASSDAQYETPKNLCIREPTPTVSHTLSGASPAQRRCTRWRFETQHVTRHEKHSPHLNAGCASHHKAGMPVRNVGQADQETVNKSINGDSLFRNIYQRACKTKTVVRTRNTPSLPPPPHHRKPRTEQRALTKTRDQGSRAGLTGWSSLSARGRFRTMDQRRPFEWWVST